VILWSVERRYCTSYIISAHPAATAPWISLHYVDIIFIILTYLLTTIHVLRLQCLIDRAVDAVDGGTLVPSAGRCRNCRRNGTVQSPRQRSSHWSRRCTGARRGRLPVPPGLWAQGRPRESWGTERSRRWPEVWWRWGRTRRRVAWTSSLKSELSTRSAATVATRSLIYFAAQISSKQKCLGKYVHKSTGISMAQSI